MSFIDWSDSEGILELLSEYVRDAINQSGRDVRRQHFLCDLQSRIHKLFTLNKKQAAERLRKIHISISPDFKDDPVAIHIKDCVEELSR